ncbi:hypothetical protein GA0116948_11258 [Chitinophaga costaii]|uniref:Glycosyltransferase 2-like domain-containing protein n=1 Tax=Chitinophaga costaii TaxID=1335309 RepID=A0A1C4F844_9BACT|nr:glycosyltransferase family 2 protein [Chitinophaga costaii]PUZ21231.1 glycosyltransferase family 2 protein [Chitinophaga costaii]SCC51681.1 hypothetical protein GA0116948_11258 [Chitinophaga costaii]
MDFDITASIVLYKTDREIVNKAISSFLDTGMSVKLYLVDNSPSNELRSLSTDSRVEYIFNNGNIGFGAAHNIAIYRALREAPYHLVLNPDVTFDGNILERIFAFMKQHPEVGQLLPRVLYNDGSPQLLCKLLPSPYDLFGRRFFKNARWAIRRNERYELADFDYRHNLNVPNLSGCFMFLRTEVLITVGVFDTRFFMYLEDVDLTRRIHKVAQTLFYPAVHIYHGFEKGSYTNPQLLKYHIRSALNYFNKWGWLIDGERDDFNRRVMNSIQALNNRKQDVSDSGN